MNIYIYNNLIKSAIILILTTGYFLSGISQTPISLEKAIEIAKESNLSIKIADQSTDIERAVLNQTKSHFLPYLGLQVSDIVTNNPLNVFGFKLLQEQVRQSDFIPDVLNNPDSRNQFNVKIQTSMPLLNMEAKARQKAVQSKISMEEAVKVRTVQEIELATTKAYYMLILSQKSIGVIAETYEAAKTNYKVAKDNYDQGLLLKSELLEMQIMVNQSKLDLNSAQTHLANVHATFNHILNAHPEKEYIPIDTTLISFDKTVLNDITVSQDRADFKAMRHGVNALKHQISAINKAFIPKLQAFGNYEINNETPFENTANNYQVGLSLNWDIYKGNARKFSRNKINSEIQKQELVIKQRSAEARLEMLKRIRNIQHLHNQIELHDLSISQSEDALEIMINRYKQGLEKSNDIINAQTNLSHKKLARIQSLVELKINKAYLQYILK